MDYDYLLVRNPDKALRERIIKSIKLNGGYCPNKAKKTQDTKCHCKELREKGECACGLFLKIPCIDVTERS